MQPLASPDDCFLAEEIVKGDPGIQALLREQYNVTDLALVACDPWSGASLRPLFPGPCPARCNLYLEPLTVA